MSYGGSDLFGFVTFNERLPPDVARPLFIQILHAVKHLHTRQIVHLDLKMENILIDNDMRIRLCDLGQARQLETPNQPQTGVTGTESYRAPEIQFAPCYIGEKADMYSLGVILFILLSGCPPYSRPNRDDRAFCAIWHGKVNEVVDSYMQTKNFLSPLASNLLSGLMCPPSRRLTVDEVLSHPWIADDKCTHT
jgi:serine/threonine protein kinase